MIPAGGVIQNETIQEFEQPSLTWKLDFTTGRITGMIDELEAIKQAVHKILETERFRYLIYSFDYGSELKSLIGSNPLFIQSEVRRMLREALTQDRRIEGIENVRTTVTGDELVIHFTLITQYGSFQVRKAVSEDV